MKGIFLLLGSNLGDREAILRSAVGAINQTAGRVVRHSVFYRTQPWGYAEQPEFLNLLLELESDLEPLPLLNALRRIERSLGRKRIEKWRERSLDIDILYYGDRVIRTARLTVPHPELHNRRFALVPLCELAPHLLHPVFGLSQVELLRDCPDTLEVVRLPDGPGADLPGEKK